MPSDDRTNAQVDGALDRKKRRDFFATTSSQMAVSLQKKLGIDEQTYRRVAGHALADARGFYLYGVLDEVIKASTSIRRWDQFLGAGEHEESVQGEDAHLVRVILESVLDEQSLWLRKLSEILCDMILFSSSNSQEYYRLHLTCRMLDAYLGLQKDFNEFFECTNFNAATSITLFLSTVEKISKSIDLAGVWFLRNAINPNRPPRPGQIFNTARARYKKALEIADPDQKIMLGTSYANTYGATSRSIHPGIGGPTTEATPHRIETRIGHVGLLAQYIVVMGHRLTGVAPEGIAVTMTEMLSGGSDATKMLERVHGKELETGDIVFAYGPDLCQVIGKARSRYGYTSYKVRYLTKPPLEEISEDWFPGSYIHLVWPRKDVRESLIGVFGEVGATEEELQKIRAIPDEELNVRIAQVMRSMDKEGTLNQMIVATMNRRPTAAAE